MKNITYILLLFSLSVFGQRPNRFNDSTYFARPVRFEVPPYLIQGAGSGKVITSDANGRMTWQTFSNSGVSQGALNDSIARLDSTINAIPTPLLTLTDDSLNISGGNTIELPYIPLSGTRPNKPVTGDIEFSSGALLKHINENEDAYNTINIASAGIGLTYAEDATTSTQLSILNDYVGVSAQNNDAGFRGLTGALDYSTLIGSLDYPQKIYVDQRISDTATQIRSEIPDVSNFATTFNLADTSALLRSLIPASSGVTQQALNDSIARLDSTIKNNSAIFPNGVKIISDTAYTLSPADAGYYLVATNANTHFIMPDTCPFSVGDVIGLYGDLDATTFDLSSSVTDIQMFTGQLSENGETFIMQCVDVGAGAEMLPLTAIKDDNGTIKTLNKYLYDKLNSVDQRISDTATQIRSEIKDTASSLHALINAKVSASGVATLTNKRITTRVDSTASSATPTINTDNIDTYKLTAQAVDITSFTTNLSGTPTDDQILHIVIIGTATRAITWGSKFEASTVALPTTTVSTDRLDVYFIWNTFTSKWRCGGVW